MKKNVILSSLILCISATACSESVQLPEMGDYTVYEVEISELSGLCFSKDKTCLLACGDKGVVKSISFEGLASDIWSGSADAEGITVDPVSGDIYLAVEGKQEVHRIAAPDYKERTQMFAVEEAVEGKYDNNGLEAVEYYKDDVIFVGSQKGATLWQYRLDGTMLSKVSLSSFAAEIAGLCYDSQTGYLWVADSKNAAIFVCEPDGTFIAGYDVPFIDNAESICVDRERDCIWVGSDEDDTKLYKISFDL